MDQLRIIVSNASVTAKGNKSVVYSFSCESAIYMSPAMGQPSFNSIHQILVRLFQITNQPMVVVGHHGMLIHL